MKSTSSKDTLGDRIKRYESVSKPLLTRRSPLMVRIDGKAFHTFTRACNKPFDNILIKAMVYAATKTAEQMQGFKLAYIQSDEATFMLTDYETLETGAWFDYELNKVVSITASLFTAHFNYFWENQFSKDPADENYRERPLALALFDARAFNVPVEDWPNVFIWRQRDWERNSIQMLARSQYSPKELDRKKVPDLHEMLYQKGINWANLDPQLKNGTFILKDGSLKFDHVNYQELVKWVK